MDFESALEYLDSFVSFENKSSFNYSEQNFDLGRLKAILDDLDLDYSKLKFIHVGGSKGKGTTCNVVAQYLKARGYSTGLFTSPHLTSVTERIKVNDQPILPQDFAAQMSRLKEFFDKSSWKVTYFELLFILALMCFFERKVDFVVLEVGLGGRLDATNIVFPLVSALTSVEKEHAAILGNSIEAILQEKLGIRKPETPFVIGEQGQEVYKLIREKVGDDNLVFFVQDLLPGQMFLDEMPVLDPALMANAKLALMILKFVLKDQKYGFDLQLFLEVLRGFQLPGRFDVREKAGKTIVLDVAHTVKSVENLFCVLREKFPERQIVVLMSIMKDKEVEDILNLITQNAKKVVFATTHPERSVSEIDFKATGTKYYADFGFKSDCVVAFEELLFELKENEILLVLCSHFLVGKILEKFF